MVNTFIVSDDYETTAKLLDYKRLGKQRVEAMQLINILENKTTTGWKNHPATKMWIGNVNELKKYTNAMITEWTDRGYKNTMKLYDTSNEDTSTPWFVLWKPLQYSHMASLVRKNREYYLPLFKNKYPIKYSMYTYLWIGDFSPDLIIKIKKGKLTNDNINLSELTSRVCTILTIKLI